MKTSISENETKALTKAIFSWSFLWFVVWLVSVVITVGFVSFGIAYFTDYFFHTDIVSAVGRMICGPGNGGIIGCGGEQLVIKIMSSVVWPIIVIPIVITVIGSRKYDRKRRGTIMN